MDVMVSICMWWEGEWIGLPFLAHSHLEAETLATKAREDPKVTNISIVTKLEVGLQQTHYDLEDGKWWRVKYLTPSDTGAYRAHYPFGESLEEAYKWLAAKPKVTQREQPRAKSFSGVSFG